jgi:very-short-patch-repair endonuclease
MKILQLLQHAKTLRKTMTDAERTPWYHLRGHRLEGQKFKRQKPLGPFIVDFVNLEHRMVIEVDGGQRADSAHDDRRRDAWLAAHGYRVLRFWNHQVLQELPAVLERIAACLSSTRTRPLPAAAGSDLAVGARLSRAIVDKLSDMKQTTAPQVGALTAPRRHWRACYTHRV